MSSLIAIVDDEQDILELVSLHLTKAGFRVSEFTDANAFMAFLKTTSPNLIILDLMLPNTDGMEICRHLKNTENYANIPIIMLTARTEEMDRVIGLELGADDYVTKPFSPRELVARVKAVLRRGQMRPEEKTITIGEVLKIDANKFQVTVKTKKVELTPTEFRILKLMSERVGWVYSRDQILDHLWGHEKAVIDRTVDVHIKHLREKLGPAGGFIKNVRGVGYKIEP
jgi:two-component system phosphate regulon response regulator PhoB/two-component system alkaline phosphatase synthesis response regulator PhoP